jgi:hypothetical protein
VQAQFAVRLGPPWWLWALVVAGAVGAAAVHWQTQQLMAQRLARQDHAEQQARDAEAALAKAAQAPLPFAADLAEIRKLRSVQWPQLLAALEVTPRGDLQVVSIDIDVMQRRTGIGVTAASMKVMLDYVQALQEGTPQGLQAWRLSVVRAAERPDRGMTAEIAGVWADR